MKQKTKDIIVGLSSTALTIGVSTMAGWAAGAGTFKLMNDLMVGGMTRGQLKLYTGVITVGSIGVGYLVADSVSRWQSPPTHIPLLDSAQPH